MRHFAAGALLCAVILGVGVSGFGSPVLALMTEGAYQNPLTSPIPLAGTEKKSENITKEDAFPRIELMGKSGTIEDVLLPLLGFDCNLETGEVRFLPFKEIPHVVLKTVPLNVSWGFLRYHNARNVVALDQPSWERTILTEKVLRDSIINESQRRFKGNVFVTTKCTADVIVTISALFVNRHQYDGSDRNLMKIYADLMRAMNENTPLTFQGGLVWAGKHPNSRDKPHFLVTLHVRDIETPWDSDHDKPTLPDETEKTVSSFKECAEAGNRIWVSFGGSFLRWCRTPDGKKFYEGLQHNENSRSVK